MKNKKILAAFAAACVMSAAGAFALSGCETHTHTFSDEWSSDAGYHWHAATCGHEDEKSDYGAHVYTDDADTTCDVCGYIRTTDPAVETGTISGTVTAYGSPLGGVKVTIGNSDTVTGATGKYSLSGIGITDSVTITFEKDGYATQTLTITKSEWTDKAVTKDVVMQLADETGTVSGTVKAHRSGGDVALSGATVKLGDATATTDSDGAYSFEDVSMAQTGELAITVSHPMCEDYSGTVEIVAGQTEVTEDIVLTPKVVTEIDKSYFELEEMAVSDKTDFPHVQNTAMWNTYGDVQTDHSEGLCLHINDNKTEDDMVSIIYQKMAITSKNSNMMFRARGFLGADGSTAFGLLAVRVIDLTDYTVEDVKGADGKVWQTMDSNGYVQYNYDLSAYEGKTVVIMIGAKQGNHNAIDRIRFIARGEEYVLPFVTADDLVSLPATPATDISDVNAAKTEFATWNHVGGQNAANEGWLFMDADYAELNSTALKVFAYKKLTLDEVGTIVIRARTFTGQNSVSSGHSGEIYPQLILRLISDDGDVIVPDVLPLVDNGEGCENFYFAFNEPLSGNYTVVIGMARGQRMAVEQLRFEEAMVSAKVAGTVKYNGEAVEGATVSYRYGKNVSASVTTAADGTFALPVTLLPGDSTTVTVSAEGMSTTFDVSGAELAKGTVQKGDIALVKEFVKGLTTETIASLTALTGNTFNTDALYDNWGKYGDIDKHGEGACLQLGTNTSLSYIYAKLNITEANRYMKFNARRFVRNSDMNGLLQVLVIENNEMKAIAPTYIVRGGQNVTESNLLENNVILNDKDDYTEAAFDLGAYVGKEIVMVIQAVLPSGEYTMKDVHNAINEVAFKDSAYFTFEEDTSAEVYKGISENDIAALTDLATTDTAAFGNDGLNNKSYWANEGYRSANDGVILLANRVGETSLIYAKFTPSEGMAFMKFNAQKTEDGFANAYIKVSVLAKGGDGKYAATALTPYRVYQGNDIKDEYIKEGCVYVDGTGYTEGVYNFSDYVGDEIVIVIEMVAPQTDGEIIKCHFNEIAFGQNGDTAFGKPSVN